MQSMKCGVSRPAAAGRVARLPRKAAVHAAAAEAAPVSAEVANMCINTIRFLAIDAVNKANSGHPGAPMGCAPMSFVLFNEVMKYNPKNPAFLNRDRFVLSAGHASMLQYAMMHLAGFDSVSMEDMKQFRQWGSVTPGHPENFETPGVEVTTGPLGQGICNAVGIAAAEAHLAARFNKPDMEPVIDHYTYCILGDGCMMEGISNEACSLAGHWGLGKLIALYDDNHISIDGNTDIAFTEDVGARYEALGWQVLTVSDGNTDVDAIRKAIAEAKACTDKPTLIKVSTLIGYGSPNKADSYAAHGAPLGADETKLTRENLKWEYGEFEVPAEVTEGMTKRCIAAGAEIEEAWNKNYAAYKEKYPEEAKELNSIMTGEYPEGWEKALPTFTSEDKGLATRAHSQTMLNALAPEIPGFLGGSADLAGSNLTLMKMFGDFQKGQYAERNLRFGVREHAMGAICNGIALYAPGFLPYCATFFIFTDYMRNAMRVSALSQAQVIFVMTHDSIGLGEDGPTHQPVEHLVSFRAMPNILTIRPCGGNETAGAYKAAVLAKKTPSIIVASRQGMPNYDGCTIDGVQKGAYVVSDSDGTPSHILIGTGTELAIAMDAAELMRADGLNPRVVSMPCTELYDMQSAEYKESVLPAAVTKRVSIEAASTIGWERYVGAQGKAIGVDKFGQSAPAEVIYKEYGLTAEAMAAAAKAL